MKLIGIAHPQSRTTTVGRLENDRVTEIADMTTFWDDPIAMLASIDSTGQRGIPRSDIIEVPAVPDRARILCVGGNYAPDDRSTFTPPHSPTIFGRWSSSLSVDGVPVTIPAHEPGLDWEVEVAAYIAAPLSNADPDTALRAVLGYSTFNDITARNAQKITSQWTLGKNVDNSGPLGPLVTADEVGDLRDGLRVQTRVNGTTVQDANTSSLIFGVGELLAFISRTMTLQPGDVLVTGTPHGVGYVRQPPWLLVGGDEVEVEVERLGTLRTPIRAS
ncbi:fumarylacetoacetate hydrolase family protein [Rhodococcoides yunnanense]|uniref:fumarylacetoacetate hydrolase family protein n=1 Tax=Rhodococcoides yunnanense TaxID=278209 RepID=UPI000934F5E2|nr:fumarylacetoacetate hydrolase family protein [Rhodococcus yunnanensis]